MSLSWGEIRTEEELEKVVSGIEVPSNKFTLILKHSTRCVLSSMAKNRLERSPDERLSYFIIDVIADRSISNALADKTDVRHESPQMFLFSGSNLISVKSHMAISPSEVSTRLDSLVKA